MILHPRLLTAVPADTAQCRSKQWVFLATVRNQYYLGKQTPLTRCLYFFSQKTISTFQSSSLSWVPFHILVYLGRSPPRAVTVIRLQFLMHTQWLISTKRLLTSPVTYVMLLMPSVTSHLISSPFASLCYTGSLNRGSYKSFLTLQSLSSWNLFPAW